MTDSDSTADITDALERALGNDAEDVQHQYSDLYTWMVQEGGNPRREQGITESTAGNYIRRLDQLHRFSMDYLDPDDHTKIRDEDADEMLRLIDRCEITQQRGRNKGEEYKETAKRKFANTLEIYFKWRYHEGEMAYEWEPKIDFSDGKTNSAYRFSYRELGLLFDQAESSGSLPSYHETPPEERETLNGLVAQRLGIPKEKVTRNDWLHADWSSKVHSLIAVGYDAGLTPVEVARAKTRWYIPESKKLKIPTEDACKEREKEEVGLADDTADALSKWLQERRHLEKYDGTGKIWLNREGNPYQSGSLCKLIRKLCEEAGIKTEGRKVVWYSLRQTMGSKVTDEGELSEANDQLRHDRLETTQESYNKTPVEKLQARLNETRRKAKNAAADPEYNPFAEDFPTDDSSSTRSTHQPSQHASDDNEVVTKLEDGGIHVDGRIPDTTEARVDITREILDKGAGE